MGGKSPSTVTSTQNSAPWSAQQPYLQDIFTNAQNLYGTGGPQYFPGQTYATPTDAQNQALSSIEAQAQNDPLASSANSGNQWLINNSVDANPTYNLWQQFAGNNLGANNAGAATLRGIAQNGVANPALGMLSGFAGNNAASSAPGSSILASLAGGGNLGTGNAGGSTLAQLMGQNYGGAGANAGSGILSQLAGQNFGQGYGSNVLAGLAGQNQGLSAPGAGTLARLSSGNLAAMNPADPAFAQYASGSHVAAGNPYLTALSQNVLSQVVPGIESQFIQGGGLSSPEAASATAAGATSALAPSLFANYQNEEANQLNAAGQLSNAYLQGTGLQGSLAGQLANLGLSGAGLQGQQAQALQQLGLSGSQLQGQQAQSLAGNILQGAGQQAGAAGQYGNLALGGSGLQGSLAQNLASNYLTGQGQQIGAAGTLGSQALQGNQLQQSAASGLIQSLLQGQGLQQQATSGLQNSWQQALQTMLQSLALSPQTQQMPYTDLSQLYAAGGTQQGLNQAQINDAIQRYNYQQTQPYQALNQYIGQVTGNYGGTSQLTQPNLGQGQNILGSALGGAGLGSAILGPSGFGLLGSGGAAGAGAGLGALLAFL